MTTTSHQSEPVRVFLSYSHADDDMREKLARHLTILVRGGVISTWHDRMILPGEEWDGKIRAELGAADIVLLLISADFLSSNYCYEVEVQSALTRHKQGRGIVIPIIVHDCLWHEAPFGRLQALPQDGRPISSWPNIHEALADVARGIQRTAEAIREPRASSLPSTPDRATAVVDTPSDQTQTQSADGASSRASPLVSPSATPENTTTQTNGTETRPVSTPPQRAPLPWDMLFPFAPPDSRAAKVGGVLVLLSLPVVAMFAWVQGAITELPTLPTSAGLLNVAFFSHAIVVLLVSATLTLILAPPVIAWLTEAQFSKGAFPNSLAVRQLTHGKGTTPIGGGIVAIVASVAGVGMAGGFRSPIALGAAILMTGLSIAGLLNDRARAIERLDHTGRYRQSYLSAAISIATILLVSYVTLPDLLLSFSPVARAILIEPRSMDMWAPAVVILSIVCLVGGLCFWSSAAQLTDGMDGLLLGCATPVFVCLGLSSFAQGSVPPGQGEHVALVTVAIVAASTTMLAFNGHPARVFLGSSGSLPLGALIAYLAIFSGCARWLPLIALVILFEWLSVVLQVAYYFLRGQRLFRCAPFHHHMHLGGLLEIQVVRRLVIVAALVAASAFLLRQMTLIAQP